MGTRGSSFGIVARTEVVRVELDQDVRTRDKGVQMSNATPSPSTNGGGGEKELRVFDEAELDAREAELDAVLDRIDLALPKARKAVQRRRADPSSRVFAARQLKRTRSAFAALGQAASEADDGDDTRRVRVPKT